MTSQETTATFDVPRVGALPEFSSHSRPGQYTIWQILGIWLAAGSPMWLLGWVAYPAMSAGLPAADAGLLRMKLLTAGLIWQFVMAMIILYREEGNLRLATIRRRFWLNHPISTRTGETRKALWWWIIPLMLLYVLLEVVLNPELVKVWTAIFPFLAEPEGYDAAAMFAPDLRARWVGAWGLLGLTFVMGLFNTLLGEELVFRGVLLPKMEGVFGRWDWAANGLMFSLYHLHQPWGILGIIPSDLLSAYAGKRFRSNWFPIILHSGQAVLMLVLTFGLVLGLA